MWNEETIKEQIKKNQAWLERAILALFEKQTSDEKITEDTHHHNKQGFNKPDAHLLSYYAKWIQSGKHLDGAHLEKARNKVLKYSGQLTKIANQQL